MTFTEDMKTEALGVITFLFFMIGVVTAGAAVLGICGPGACRDLSPGEISWRIELAIYTGVLWGIALVLMVLEKRILDRKVKS